MTKVVICYSGGLDSFAMRELAIVREVDFTCVYFHIGQPYAEKELAAIQKLGVDVDIRYIDWFVTNFKAEAKGDSASGSIIIPGRNAVFAQLAASIYQPDEIWMGALKGEDHAGSTDKNQLFLDVMNAQLGYVHSPFATVPRVRFPFIEMNWGKLGVVQSLMLSGITENEITSTSSCLEASTGKNCGRCVVCARRAGIFRQLGMDEEYEVEPFSYKGHFPMFIEMLRGDVYPSYKCHYDRFRRDEILPTLRKFYQLSDDDLFVYLTQTMEKE